MKDVLFSRNIDCITSAPSKDSLGARIEAYYINCSDNDEVSRKLEEKGYSDGLNEGASEHQGWRFLQAYVELIDRLGEQNDSLRWWTSELATRNHFTTQTPYQVYLLSTIRELIQSHSRIKVLIYGMNVTLEDCLKEALSHSSVRLIGSRKWLKLRTRIRSIKFYLQGIIIEQIKTIFLIFRWLLTKALLGGTERKNFLASGRHVVIKTFLLPTNMDRTGSFEDPYFEPLTAQLTENGKSIVILTQITHGYLNAVWRLRKARLTNIFPFEYFISLRDIILMGIKACIYSPKIKIQKLFEIEIGRLLKDDFARTRVPISQLVFYCAAKNIATDLDIERFIMTYENRGWENACLLGLRQGRASFPIVGYQHTVVLQAAMAYYLGRYEKRHKPLPDKIITVGPTSRTMMLEHGFYPENAVVSGVALRTSFVDTAQRCPVLQNRGNILLVLEGVPQMERLVTYCLTQFKDETCRTLMIRTHPEMPIGKYSGALQTAIRSAGRAVLSENKPLYKDLEEADICIYWGSTVSLHAVAMGIPLINFSPPSPVSYDPLFMLTALKWSIHAVSNLQDTIDSIYRLDESQYQEQCLIARQYLRNYFVPVTKERLNLFLN
jgi:hypothetical protein